MFSILYYVAFCVAMAGPCSEEACACTIYIGWTSTLSSLYELQSRAAPFVRWQELDNLVFHIDTTALEPK